MPRLLLASLSGVADADWARAGAPYADAAVLGGLAVDGPTRRAARKLVARGREEFLPADPIAFVERQCTALAGISIRPVVNVRARSPPPIARVARACARHDAGVEINAHCRQSEMCAVGAGEALLADPSRLCAQVRAASEHALTGVKLRAETGVDLPALAVRLAAAGADRVHVDAMDSEPVVGAIVDAVGASVTVIANNGVRGRATAHEYLAYGADAVSVGRPSDDPVVLDRVRTAVDAWFDGADDGETADRVPEIRSRPAPEARR